jgi:hypothetical protein
LATLQNTKRPDMSQSDEESVYSVDDAILKSPLLMSCDSSIEIGPFETDLRRGSDVYHRLEYFSSRFFDIKVENSFSFNSYLYHPSSVDMVKGKNKPKTFAKNNSATDSKVICSKSATASVEIACTSKRDFEDNERHLVLDSITTHRKQPTTSSSTAISATCVTKRRKSSQVVVATRTGSQMKRVSFSSEKPVCNRPLARKRQASISDTVNKVLLINSDIEENFIVLPECKEKLSQAKLSPAKTLELLRQGIWSFMNARRFGESETSFGEDSLEIFCCKLPQKRKYYFYKRVRCIEIRNEGNQSTLEENASTYYDMFKLINRYIKCFATLAEFSFELSVPKPLVSSGLSNVLVLDKVWNYNHEKSLYVPSYKTLDGDAYTDYVISSLKRSYNCGSIVFISTLHTAMFANYDVLGESTAAVATQSITQQMMRHESARVNEETPIIGGVVAAAAAESTGRPTSLLSSDRPLKKRKVVVCSSDSQQGASRSTCSATAPGPEQTESPSAHIVNSAFLVSTPPANPTLVVLKQPYIKENQWLVCPISIEIHLANQIKYN